jgi:SAM-dependent methyltransferase
MSVERIKTETTAASETTAATETAALETTVASDYDPFAFFFNKYWSREIPEQMMFAIRQVLLARLPDGARLLDLCCGTGQLAAALSARGYSVMGLDNSEAMLRYARRNAPAARFIRADARRFQLPDTFDAVISTFDSLNHFLSPEELAAVFGQTLRALAPAGWFLFDINVERGFLAHWRDYFAIVEEREVCLLRGDYDPQRKLGRYDITMFRLHGKMWQRADTTIVERCYERAEIERELKRAGFTEVLAFDAAEDLGLADHTGRIFFLAR